MITEASYRSLPEFLWRGSLKLFRLNFVPISWNCVSFHFLKKVIDTGFLRRSLSKGGNHLIIILIKNITISNFILLYNHW